LQYHSDAVSVQPVVDLTIPTDTTTALPPSITVGFTFNGVSQTPVTYTTSGFSPGDVLTVAQQANTVQTSGTVHRPQGRFMEVRSASGVRAKFAPPQTGRWGCRSSSSFDRKREVPNLLAH
jgi:hypothetical protein